MKNPLKKKFAQFLKEKRAAKGLTYKEFSLLIYGEENKKNYLQRLEKEKGSPNLKSLSFICQKLNTEVLFNEH